MSELHSSGVNLPRKYRPKSLAEVRGQSVAVNALLSFVAAVEHEPASAAFVFYGATGTGKSCAAEALANALGCASDRAELGGFYQVASGTQDGRAVDELLRSLSFRPLFGSGWRVAVINEADRMTAQAETMWLDRLEQLPNRTVMVFTTNEIGRLTDRLTSRCESYEFSATSVEFRGAMEEVIREVWAEETGKRLRRLPEGLGRFELGSDHYSLRLALQQIAPYTRNGKKLPRKLNIPIVRTIANGCSVNGSAAASKAWETRRRNREKLDGET